MTPPPVIVILGARSLPLARRVQAALGDAPILAPAGAGGDVAFADAAGTIRERFQAGHPIVGLCAAAILIRALVPCLADKRVEPPVVAIDEAGRHVVPLLGGHRGANALARRLALALDAVAAVTTASDAKFGLALDDPPPGWRLADPAAVKPFMAALLEGTALRLDDPDGLAGWLRGSGLPLAVNAPLAIEVTHRAINLSPPARLVYHPPVLALGVGCDRGCPADDLIGLAEAALADAGLAPGAVALVVSLDLKAAEPAVHALAAYLSVPARFLARAELAAQESRLRNPSEAVRREVGVAGVAEGAALAAVGDAGTLIVPKRKSARATVALGLAPAPLDPSAIGRKRGTLAVVGLGPGGPTWRTAEAEALIRAADEAVGYSLYLDLAADLLRGKPAHAYPLGEERDSLPLRPGTGGDRPRRGAPLLGRPRHLRDGGPGRGAAGGRRRPGRAAGGGPDRPRRLGVSVGRGTGRCPDRARFLLRLALRPADADGRHRAAARSRGGGRLRRRALQPRLGDAAQRHPARARHPPGAPPPDTPTVVARNLGRDGERVEVIDLEALDADKVDMLTLVLIGGRNSRRFTAPDGRVHVVTPRGYKV